jgi:hypothetical protein
VVVFERFGPYHISRLNGATRYLSVEGIELSQTDPTYAWDQTDGWESFPRPSQVFSPDSWRIIRSIGLEYIALVFFVDLVVRPIEIHAGRLIDYAPFSSLLILGTLLRSAAAVRRSRLGAKAATFRATCSHWHRRRSSAAR